VPSYSYRVINHPRIPQAEGVNRIRGCGMADGCLDVDETRLGAADIDEQGADDDLRFS